MDYHSSLFSSLPAMITAPIISSLTEGKPPWSMFNRDPPGQLVIQKRNQDQLSSIAVFWRGRGVELMWVIGR